ncbi:DUF7344 domain-containing protein [Halorientalis marina]|jgi:hypothetical protein|uniref:DUF7344 domain-containing protein n=1 Tax=Halorientalis marina TaxID=2931976 RepID=UPI001FF109CE|nr:hypothetical protein [Halorientalis marina]
MAHSGGYQDGSESSRGPSSTRIAALFELLADEERQVIVQYLLSQSDESVPVADLVDALVRSFGYERTRAVLRLRHDHLPRLADRRLIDYDDRRSLVWFDERADHDDLHTLFEVADAISSARL